MTQDEWRDRVVARLGKVEDDLAQLKTQSAVDEVHQQNVEKRLAGIENSMQWLVRAVLGGIVAAAMAFMISGGFAP